MILSLEHVQLAMPKGEETRARAFYGGVLGLEEIEKPEALTSHGGLWFRLGEQGLHLGIEEPFTPAKKAHPALRVRGLEALAATFAAHGIAVSWDELLPDVHRFYVQDPFGNRLELLESTSQAP